jgi:hypothetical protein
MNKKGCLFLYFYDSEFPSSSTKVQEIHSKMLGSHSSRYEYKDLPEYCAMQCHQAWLAN